MVTVRFYGRLKQFGSTFRLDCKDTAEILKALFCQLPGLRQHMQQGIYKVRIGKEYLDNRFLEKGLLYKLKDGMTVHFIPVVQGAKKAGVFQLVVGAVLTVVGFATSWTGVGAMVGMMGVSMMLGGVAQMLTKTPSMNQQSGQKGENKTSTSFNNIQNRVAQGQPIPLAYGRIRCGSMIISQGIETFDAETAKTA